jgi:hypothetical protein
VKPNSQWRPGGPRHDGRKIPCVPCNTEHSLDAYVQRHFREKDGFVKGARVTRYAAA